MRGGLFGLVFVAPAAVAGELLADRRGRVRGGAALVVTLFELLGFAFAGYAARRLAPDAPLRSAALAGAVAWGVLQAVGVVTSLARDQALHPLTLVATALLAAAVATAGALLAGSAAAAPGARRS
ncbi:MAG: hypothetical protein HYX34_03515 [Actinobacteria bacterium]|nr:hypothetical protein [Actinomycetota bacterium]